MSEQTIYKLIKEGLYNRKAKSGKGKSRAINSSVVKLLRNLIYNLLRRAGGNVRRQLYIPLLRKYNETLRAIKLHPGQYNASAHKGLNIKSTVNPEYENYNPYHPASIEVVKQRKKWDAMMSKYRSEVQKEERKLSNKPDEENKGSSKAAKGGAKSKKSGKKSDKSEKSKGKDKGKSKGKSKGKGKGKGKDKANLADELDWLQLLPIGIVKKIFSYLDQKTLKNLKKVNGYHAYVVQELSKEMKMRKKLDMAIVKLQAEVNPAKLEEALKSEERFKGPIYKLPRQINKEQVGVLSAKLVPKKKGIFAETSLMTQVAVENGDYLPYEVFTFPRIIKEDMLLYRYQPCFLKDVNLALGTREMEEQSFVTYSLNSQTSSSSRISVDEATLQDW